MAMNELPELLDISLRVTPLHPVDPSTVVLGIETSCDETAAALVMGGKDVLSSVVSSQVDLHAAFGGVVPEIASRAHLELLNPVIAAAVVEAGLEESRVDAVACTIGPGLELGAFNESGSLLIEGTQTYDAYCNQVLPQMVQSNTARAALPAWSGSGSGAPQNAITASPRNWLT